LFQGADEFEAVMEQIAEAAQRRYQADGGKLVMTKVVGGFVATK
jgi:hypothetical protein